MMAEIFQKYPKEGFDRVKKSTLRRAWIGLRKVP
jgi:hypothetical protein